MTYYQAIVSALEWRVIAVILQTIVLAINGLSWGEIGLITLETQIVLFIGQVCWIRWRVDNTTKVCLEYNQRDTLTDELNRTSDRV